MGSFLEKPITEKETDQGDGPGFLWAMSAMQGWRVEMEDAHCVHPGFDDQKNSFIGVFDGHGGSTVSKYCGAEMLNCILKAQEEGKDDMSTDEGASRALTRGHMLVDELLLEKPEFRELQDHSGSTAITAYITKDKMYVANCGDSRCVLGTGGGVVPMSEDHKPCNPGEKARIDKAGGTVSMKRVDGDLAVSRSLGDFSYKQTPGLPANEQKVSAEPEVKMQPRSAKDDEFLILACDGIWDVVSNEECVELVRQRLQEECDLGLVCEFVIDHCLNLNSRDNMSVAIVVFPACKRAAEGVHAATPGAGEEEEADPGGMQS